MRITSVSAVQFRGLFCLNRSDSGLVGLFGRDRSDPAAHAKHYAQYKSTDIRREYERNYLSKL